MTSDAYFIFLAIGAAVGLAVDFGEKKIRGRTFIVPFVGQNARNTTIAAVVLVIVAVTSSVTTFNARQRQIDCDRQQYAALQYNADVTAVQKRNTGARNRLEADVRKVNRDLYASIVLDPNGAVELITDAGARATDIESQIVQLDQRNAELESTRKPYPAPTCGSR